MNLYNANNSRKRQCIMRFIVLLPVIIYISVSLSAITQMDVNAKNLSNTIIYVLQHPFLSEKISNKTGAFLFAGVMIWMVAFAMSYTKASMNLMHGAEHGTASWGNAKEFNKKYSSTNESENKILSENIRMTYDKSTLRNNNMFVVGGSGAGKTAFLVTPNLLNLHGSNIYTDPKGGLLKDYGEFLKKQPNVRLYQINLCEMNKSMRFNPFEFIRTEADVPKLITNIMKNTTPADANAGDPFWEKAEGMYLQSIFYYIWLECPQEYEKNGEIEHLEMNFSSVLKLLDEAKIDEESKKTEFELRLERLAQREPNHIAVRTYDRMKVATKAEETVASIILCANSRFNIFDNPELLNVLSDNDIPLDEIGTGINHDGKTQSYLFLIIPDDDTTYNFIPGMIYTLLFQELYYQARFYPGNKLPLDVGFWFDEFANIKMPANFEEILATCRSRGVYCVPILQSLAQIKKLYKDGAWEGVVGNCDTFIYLGGNEQSSHKYISELLGKWTIDKKTEGESKGTSGSSSQNYDVVGRDLIDASEMRLLPNEKEIIFVKGEKPLIDRKWHPWEYEIDRIAKSYGEYSPDTKVEKNESIELVNQEQLYFYENQSEYNKNINIIDVDLAAFLAMDFTSMQDDGLSDYEIEELMGSLTSDKVEDLLNSEKKEIEKKEFDEFKSSFFEKTIFELLKSKFLSDERKELMIELQRIGFDEKTIKKEVYIDIPIEEVREAVETAKRYY